MSDEASLRAASRGDTAALEQLIRGLAPTVYAYLAGMLADEQEAADALQETFVRAARALSGPPPDEDPTQWIIALARRVTSDVRPTPSAHPGALPDDPDDRAAWARRALRSLEAEHREIIVCKDVLGWSDATIADALGISTHEVAQRLRIARDRLMRGVRSIVDDFAG